MSETDADDDWDLDFFDQDKNVQRSMFSDELVEHFQGVSKRNTIEEMKQVLRSMDNDDKDINFRKVLEGEKRQKNRKGMKKWLNAIIEGDISVHEEVKEMDYMDALYAFKSALQKAIRRGNTERALRFAQRYYKMSRDDMIRRLKVIIFEDSLDALWTLEDVEDDYERTIVTACEATKNKDAYWLSKMAVMNEDGDFEEEYIEKFVDRYGDKEQSDWEEVMRQAGLYLNEIGKVDEFEPEAEADDFEVYTAQDEELKWYAFDMHTRIGKSVMEDMVDETDYTWDEIEWAWWFGSSIKLDEMATRTEVYEEMVNQMDKHPDEHRKLWNDEMKERAKEGVIEEAESQFGIDVS